MCRPIYAAHFIQRWVNFDILPHLRASRLRRVMRSHRGATGVMYVAVRQRGLRVPAITWYRCRCSPGHQVTGMSRRSGAGRGATSRPAGTGDHLGPGPPGRALPIGIGHRDTGMSRRAGAGAVPVGVRHRGLRVPAIIRVEIGPADQDGYSLRA